MKLKRYLLLALLLPAPAMALQNIPVSDGDSVTVGVSADELTRFSIEGGRIVRIWGPDDRFAVEPDKDSGQLFMRLLDKRTELFSVFVKDERGGTYTIQVRPENMPADSVVLQPQGDANARLGVGGGYYPGSTQGRPYNWVKTLKEMVRNMALGTLPGAETANQTVDVGLPGKLVLLERYAGALTGEVYEFTADAELTLDERQFEALTGGDGLDVKAVAMDELQLAAGQTTRVYIIKSGDGP